MHHKLPFGFELSTNVLEREDESFVNQILQGTGKAAINIIDTVRSAIKENRQRVAMRLGSVDDRVQLHAVAHGNHLLDLVEAGGRILWLCGLSDKRNRREE